MAGLCKASIIGNLGGDPEMRYTQGGKPVTSFNVACNTRRRGPDGEMVEDTQWFRVVCFSKLAEFASEYLGRGRRVFVEGRLQSRSWDGADGQKRFTMEIVAGDLVMLDQRPRTEGGEGVPVGARPVQHDADLEDLPF